MQRARLNAEVTAVEGNKISLRLEGETRAVHRLAPPGEAAKERGVETRLFGKATYEKSKERFTALELVAIGTRWHSKGNFPLLDPGPTPIGFFFTLAGDAANEKLAPSRFGKYGWKK